MSRLLCAGGIVLVLCVALASFGAGAADSSDAPIFDIPRLADITIDGNGADWDERGFRVDLLSQSEAKASSGDFSPSFRLAWDEHGLLVLVNVVDSTPVEFEKTTEMWKGDSVEFFVATARGSNDSYQVVVSPGRDAKTPQLRYTLSDYRHMEGDKERLGLTVARSKDQHGYVIEALLPWENLKIEPKEGRELAFQLYVNNSDKPGERTQALWYPQSDTYNHTERMHRIRLAAAPSPAVRALVSADYDKNGQPELTVSAMPALLGKKVRVNDSCKVVGKAKLEEMSGRVGAKMDLSPPKGSDYGPLTISIDGAVMQTIVLPQPKK